MPAPVEQFVESLSTTGLLSPEEVQFIRSDVSSRKLDVQTLARELVNSGKLTRFQAMAIHQGKIKGLTCGEYLLLDKLGAGGMGQVFKARHKRLNRIVAIKMFAPNATMDQDKALRRFSQEMQLAARLSHPNIVATYDAGEHEGLHYLVMEYVEGQDLASSLRPDKSLTLPESLGIVLQVARGLEYAHAQGIVHRDIKPNNLLIDPQGTVKILDMGLAHGGGALSGANAPAPEGITQSGEVMGTADYMAPEQARDTRSAGPQADIYSLGCTLFRLVAGHAPYGGNTAVEKILAHIEQPIPSLRQHCPAASVPLGKLFQRMLAKAPGDRISSMSEVIAELQACLGDAPSSSAGMAMTETNTLSAAPTQQVALPSIVNRSPVTIYTAGGVAAVLLMAVVGWWFTNRASTEEVVAQEPALASATTPRLSSGPAPAREEGIASPEPPASVEPTTTVEPPVKTMLATVKTEATKAESTPPPGEPTRAKPVDPPTAIPVEGLDLLKRLDLQRDVIDGTWKLEQSVLACETTGRVQFPQTPPPEYDLYIEAEAAKSAELLILGLVVGASQVGFNLTPDSNLLGLSDVDGKSYRAKGNPTRYVGATVSGEQPFRLLFQVRSTGVLAKLNDQTVVDWKGSPQQLSVSPSTSGPDKTKLFLQAQPGSQFQRYALFPPGGAPRTAPTTAPAPVPTQVAKTPAASTKPGVRVDLMRLVDVKRDALDGTWAYDGKALQADVLKGKGSPDCRIQFPYAPPPEYDLTIEFEPPRKNIRFTFGLVVGPSRAGFQLDRKGETGLSLIDGKAAYDNETTVTNSGIIGGAPNLLICRVRPTSVLVKLNGRTLVDWTGDATRLSAHTSIAPPDPSKLFASTGNTFRFTKYEVTPLGGDPLPVPSADAVAAVQPRIKELIGDLPTTATALRRASLAANLHAQAAFAGDDDALKYTLLTEAIKLATLGEDLKLVLVLLEDLGRCFQVDALSTFNKVLGDIAAAPRSPTDRKQLVGRFLELAEEQALVEHYDVAQLLAKSASSMAEKMTEADLKREVQMRQLEADEWQKLWAAAKDARLMLAKNPAAPDAHLTLGQYQAIARSDWKAALPLLAKGNDNVGAVAQLELQAAADPAKAVEIGAAWLALAEKAAIPAKITYHEHARIWLSRGAAGLSKSALTILQGRFKKVELEARKVAGLAFLKRHSLRAVRYGNHWYQFMHDELSWHDARQRCLEMGGELVAIETPAECQFVYQYAVAQFAEPDLFSFWIGATEEGHDKIFTWTNYAPVQFADWDQNRPDNKIFGEAVLATRVAAGAPQFKWGDDAPSKTCVFICEWDR